MKKSVAILIGIIFIASIFIINLFGLKMAVYNEKVSVAKIECISETKEGYKTGQTSYPINGASNKWENIMYVMIPFSDPGKLTESGGVTGTNYFMQMRVYPDNASQKDLTFTNYSNTKNVDLYVVGANQYCYVLFSKPSTVVIKVTSQEKNNPTFFYIKLIAS